MLNFCGGKCMPGDSSRDLFIPKRWVGHQQPLSSGHVNSPSQKGHLTAELPGAELPDPKSLGPKTSHMTKPKKTAT